MDVVASITTLRCPPCGIGNELVRFPLSFCLSPSANFHVGSRPVELRNRSLAEKTAAFCGTNAKLRIVDDEMLFRRRCGRVSAATRCLYNCKTRAGQNVVYLFRIHFARGALCIGRQVLDFSPAPAKCHFSSVSISFFLAVLAWTSPLLPPFSLPLPFPLFLSLCSARF